MVHWAEYIAHSFCSIVSFEIATNEHNIKLTDNPQMNTNNTNSKVPPKHTLQENIV